MNSECVIEYDWNNKVVLIAEDEDFNFFFLEAALDETNITVVRAENGVEAVNLYCNGGNYDVVLMDINMPKMDGVEAAKLMKKTGNNIPVIAQTALGKYELDPQSDSEVFDHYLVKPINPDALLDTIHKALNRKTS